MRSSDAQRTQRQGTVFPFGSRDHWTAGAKERSKARLWTSEMPVFQGTPKDANHVSGLPLSETSPLGFHHLMLTSDSTMMH